MVEITFETLSASAQEVDGTGTKAKSMAASSRVLSNGVTNESTNETVFYFIPCCLQHLVKQVTGCLKQLTKLLVLFLSLQFLLAPFVNDKIIV